VAYSLFQQCTPVNLEEYWLYSPAVASDVQTSGIDNSRLFYRNWLALGLSLDEPLCCPKNFQWGYAATCWLKHSVTSGFLKV